jgi:uncharacterized Zn finger protein
MSRREGGLFPQPPEITFSCSCPDWAGMCKHVAATLYGVGARLDQQPELLFVLRSADHLELVTAATESVAAGAKAPGADTIATDALADVFGIEIDFDVAPPAADAVVKQAKTAPARVKTAARKAAPPKPVPRRRPPLPVVKDGTKRRKVVASPRTGIPAVEKKGKPPAKRAASRKGGTAGKRS